MRSGIAFRLLRWAVLPGALALVASAGAPVTVRAAAPERSAALSRVALTPVPADSPGTLPEPPPVRPLFKPPAPVRKAAAKKAPATKAAAKKPPAKKVAAKKPAPVKRVAARKKRTPLNSTHVRGLYTVERQGTGVSYRKGVVLGVGINVIEADLSDPEVRVGAMVASGGIGTAERFGRMVQRAQPAAAITGTFFGIRNHIPTGDLVINGRPIFRGFIGTAVAITEGNVVSFVPTQYKGRAVDWSMFDTVIRGGPRLVDQGIVTMTARSEGFRSLPISSRRTRTAVGLTRDNHLQFVAVRQGITLWELAKLMKAIGAYHAVALDGGTSTAMYFAGRYIASPGRTLTNAMLIYHRRDSYDSAKHRFAGPYVPRSKPTVNPASVVPAPGTVPVQPPADGFEPAQDLDFPLPTPGTEPAPTQGK